MKSREELKEAVDEFVSKHKQYYIDKALIDLKEDLYEFGKFLEERENE